MGLFLRIRSSSHSFHSSFSSHSTTYHSPHVIPYHHTSYSGNYINLFDIFYIDIKTLMVVALIILLIAIIIYVMYRIQHLSKNN